MPKKVRAIPKGFRTVTPYLVIRNCAEAVKFYQKAFDAKKREVMKGPDGKGVMHAEIEIGNSVLMMCDEMPIMQGWVSPQQLNGTTVCLSLYVEDADQLYKKAVKAGCTVTMPLADQFWGDRCGRVRDPYGHEWFIATHIADFTPKQISKAAAAFLAGLPAGKSR
ncbi:MAG: VOC family protein [Planctomycetota bacterium]|nr:MAG: VOC family protein [Planctomycetota bacterium]